MEMIREFVKVHGQTIGNLAQRWQDESQYEDINQYRDVIAGLLPQGMLMQGMMKRPFGFKFRLAGRMFRLEVKRNRITVYGE